jgi:lysophospholipase L1-like esterase
VRSNGRWSVRSLVVVCAVLGLLVAGCGGSDDPGTGPDPLPPTISCPANRQAPASQGQPTPVNYDVPVAQNGKAPVNVVCDPASGSAFPIGDTTVTCTATDALARSSTCSFTVSVTRVPQLSVTKITAFGDSLTEGTTSPDPVTLALNPPESYPFQLQSMLAARYTDQTIDVFNEGCGGEFTVGSSTHCAGGVARLPEVLERNRPQVLLLMHGANDLRRPSRSISAIVGAMETMVGEAQRSGVTVIVASLPPQNPEGSRGDGAPRLPEYTRELARMAEDEGAGFLDLFNLLGTWQGYIGVDGLHPTPTGYQRIAELWQEELQRRYEVASEPPPTLQLTRTGARLR